MRFLSSGVLIRLALWLTLTVALVAGGVVALYENKPTLGATALLVAALCMLKIFKLVMSYSHKAAFMFNAIENHDFTFRFAQNSGHANERYFNESLNRIKDLIRSTEEQIIERERYYESIINSSSIGILVFDTNSGIVYKTNTAAETLLGMSGISHINQLERLRADVPQTLMRATASRSTKISFFNETSQITLSIVFSKIPLRGREMTIAAMSDIREQIDDTMNESWIKLSRVLTHEIMNSLAPITSLSEELRHTTDRNVINRGLEIISSTGRELINFVENYRRLTRLPQAVLDRFDLSELIARTAEMMERPIDISQLSVGMQVVADRGMIAQVVNNLMRNAIEATLDTHHIYVRTSFDTLGRATAEFCNDGPPIDRATAENIFVPFFTTKNGGSGIGLSLSRQIMRLNNGAISHSTRTINGRATTVFTLHFYQIN